MLAEKRLKIGFLFLLFYCSLITARVCLTNVICKSFDESIAKFEYCYIKAVNRSYTYISAKMNLVQKPVNYVTVNLAVLKRANGYKPFLYNLTFDVCKFLRSKNPNPVIKYFYECIRSFSNMNHSCPYNHDLVVDKMDTNFLNNHFTKVLPFPKGDYVIDVTWFDGNKRHVNVRGYGSVE